MPIHFCTSHTFFYWFISFLILQEYGFYVRKTYGRRICGFAAESIQYAVPCVAPVYVCKVIMYQADAILREVNFFLDLTGVSVDDQALQIHATNKHAVLMYALMNRNDAPVPRTPSPSRRLWLRWQPSCASPARMPCLCLSGVCLELACLRFVENEKKTRSSRDSLLLISTEPRFFAGTIVLCIMIIVRRYKGVPS